MESLTKVPRRRYKYDAALSFAGEDRKVAAALSRQIRRFGLSVFYDVDHQAELWGKTPEAFERIYGPQARYVIPLISKHYPQKPWTQFEFDTAQREQRKRGREFILPVRLDDTRLLGLPDSKIRIDARESSVAQIAKLFAEKCGATARSSRPPSAIPPRAISLLTPSAHRALGLMASAAVPLPVTYFEKLFPQYPWRRLVTEFRTAGLTDENSRDLIELRRPVLKALTNDRAASKELNESWINRLRPLQDHVDAAAFLVMHLMSVHRFEEAANIAAPIAYGVESDEWTGAYVTLLSAFRRRRPFRALSRQTRLEVLNSLGTALSHAGKHSEALRVFSQLRRLSRSYGSSWGTGQSLINTGVAAHNLGDTATSTRMYEQAVKHAKRSRDELLLGRALSNLAQAIQDEEPERAEQLLEESLRAKAKAKDLGGVAIGRAVRAGIATSRGEFELAAQLFKEASTEFRRLGMRHDYALSVYNQGRALQDANKVPAAVRMFGKARTIAERSHFPDVLRLSLNALGAALFAQGRYAASRDCGHALLKVARLTANQEDELGAVHMLAVSHLALGNERDANSHFRQAISKARRLDLDEFLSRCLIDSTRRPGRTDSGIPDSMRLQTIATREATRRPAVAAHVWRAIAGVAAAGGHNDAASRAYERAAVLLPPGRGISTRLDLAREHFAWAWASHRYDEALQVLSRIERRESRPNSRDAIDARDQRGVCLQELGRHQQAEPLHRSAVAEAQRAGDLEQMERSLNNLGEALRAQDRLREAIDAFRTAEALARNAGRHENAISTAHNRALALQQQDRLRSASLVLRRCRDESRRRHLWRELVRSLEGLGNLSWQSGDRSRSMRLYQLAMRKAQQHGLADLQPRIAMNIGRLSLAEDRARYGLTVLSRFEQSFSKFPDAHDYLGTLAELQEAVGQTQIALGTWRASKYHAEARGDAEHVGYCERHEVALIAAAEEKALTEKSLRAAIAGVSIPDQRAELLIQLVRLLARRKKTAAAQAAFDEAMRLCTQAQLHARRVELFVTVGDGGLSGKRAEQLNALKAYVMAMIITLESDPDSSARLASRITFKLASANCPISARKLRSLTVDVRTALAKETPDAPAKALRFLVWPLEVAAQLIRFRTRPRLMKDAVEYFARPGTFSRYLRTGNVTR